MFAIVAPAHPNLDKHIEVLYSRRLHKMKFKLRRYYLYYLARVSAFKIYLLPRAVSMVLAGLAGAVAFLLGSKYRNIALDNLRSVFGSTKSDRQIQEIARAVFVNLAKNAVELVTLPKVSASNIDSLVSIEGRDILDRELAKGRGVIVVTGHFGNWELMPVTLRIKGYAGSVIGRRIYFDRYDRYLNSLRKAHGVEIIYRDDSPRKILKVLKSNGVLGIVADQDVDSVDGVFVEFFGRRAYTPLGPVSLAKVTGAPIVPAFMIREGRRHRLVFEKPIELVDTGNKDADNVENTKRWSDVVEAYIRKYPEQWVWMHRRWKTENLKLKVKN